MQIFQPNGIAVNRTDGSVYVTSDNRVRKIVGTAPCEGPSSSADLWMKDTAAPDLPEDFGIEPNQTAPSLFISSDMWVLPFSDTPLSGAFNPGPDSTLAADRYYANEHQHQDPVYLNSTTPSYVYVKVRNRGYQSSTGTEKLRVYWASASTGLAWNSTGMWTEMDCVPGGATTPCSLPAIAPGRDYVAKLQWVPPNPASFGGNQHFCLIARIETQPNSPYGMTQPEGTTLWANVAGNNNIVWKNLAVLTEGECPGRLIVRNTLPREERLTLRFAVQERELKDIFLLHGEIFVELGAALMAKWRKGGQPPQGFQVVGSTIIKITDPSRAALGGLLFAPGEAQTIEVRMRLRPGDKARPGTRFNWDVIQLAPLVKSGRPVPIGGERYVFTVRRTAGINAR